MDSQNRVQWVYSSRNNQELAERYDQWAKDYDQDLEQDFDWLGPQRAAEVFAQHVPINSRILDAGAGTGLVGEFLAAKGYGQIIAMDLSAGMLEEASKKNVYQEFHQMVMGEPLGFDTGSFDAVVSVGVLTVGHAPASSLDELVRITKPGGYVVFSLRPDVYESAGFKEKQAELESVGKWKLTEESDKFQPLPKGEPEVMHQVWVYQVCA
ncbi:MAG: class I SAM-dependent methyltransferase [Chloroflexi bacterium]|nr:class I SAM-dependent methyltransferase [Chloroflexota bacterium]MDA1220309.1 class I SAM-dependent methyltransferase [Chloroflexota bacterium]